MNEKTVRLFHKADWIEINFAIRSTMTKTTLNKMTITEDEIDNYVQENANRLQKRISRDITTRKRDSWGTYCDDMELSEGQGAA